MPLLTVGLYLVWILYFVWSIKRDKFCRCIFNIQGENPNKQENKIRLNVQSKFVLTCNIETLCYYSEWKW